MAEFTRMVFMTPAFTMATEGQLVFSEFPGATDSHDVELNK